MTTRKTRKKSKIRSMMPRSRAMYAFVSEEWDALRTVCSRRWSHIDADLLPDSFSDTELLGSGYFGIVLATNSKKLVVKITSDRDEGYFNNLILNDPFLRYNTGLPLVLDCFHIPEWGAHVILRENLRFGISKLPESSPLSRAIPILDKFGEQSIRIEARVSQMLRSLNLVGDRISRADFTLAYREAQGLVRSEIIKALKTMPSTSESSKYHAAMSVIRHSLDKYGIALWDLHNLNLGHHIYDMSEFDENSPELDTECVVILDVGGNFGSPIMSQLIDEEDVH
jgi:hypothetical protein